MGGSGQGHPAIDTNIGTRDEAAGVGCQEKRGAGQFFGAAEPTEGNGFCQFYLERGPCVFCDTQLGEDRGVNRSGTQHIDPDAASLEFQRPTSCKCLDRRLAASLDGMAFKDLVARD